MRQVISLLCIASLLCTIAGCENNETPNQPEETTVTTEEVTESTTAQSEETAGQPEGTSPATETEKPEETEPPTEATPAETDPPKPQSQSNAVWKEVPIPRERSETVLSMPPFNSSEILTGYDSTFGYKYNMFIFRGTVLSLKEYEITWTGDNGEKIESPNSAIIEVKINKEYSGKSPVEGDTIKIYLPHSLAWDVSSAPELMKNGEYVFITKVLDEIAVKAAEELTPSFKAETAKHADVSLGDLIVRIFPVENGYVAVRRNYFEHDEKAMEKILTIDENKKKKSKDPEFLESGVILLRLKDFEKEFVKLIKSAEKAVN